MNFVALILSPWTILSLSWALPIYGLIYNRFNPSYESALSVPYGFLIGCIIHAILMVSLLFFKRSKSQKSTWYILGFSFSILLILTFISNSGALSQVSKMNINLVSMTN